jgi:hypothetical protein
MAISLPLSVGSAFRFMTHCEGVRRIRWECLPADDAFVGYCAFLFVKSYDAFVYQSSHQVYFCRLCVVV